MAGIIKKQILKHLSRFTKNLSPDKINLSTLKGEGELKNLELDEEVLQNMLDLPTWLAINKVFCNKASIRIPWTKLKTHPICLSLDKVIMEMSTCEEPRAPNGPSPIATASGQSEYGFAEKVVEGITVSVNSIVIRIGAKAFNASFELSQLRIYSVNANWEHGDLRFTRIQDPQRGEVLTFKEINWQMIRIEADATQSSHLEFMCAPVRLITNQSKIRVTLKRRLKDCNVIATKLVLTLDDLLWVLTDSQLKAMVQYAKSLSEAIEKSTEQRKSMAPEPTQPESNRRITGGAMQLSFTQLTIDYYPYHKAGDSCSHWMYFSDATKTKNGWANELLHEFECNVEMLKQAVKDHNVGSPPKSPTHASPQHTQTGQHRLMNQSTFKINITSNSNTQLVIPSEMKSECHQDQPRAISIQSSEMIATNTRHCPNCRHSDLEALFQDFKDCDFFSKTYTSFPKSCDNFNLLHPIFQRHAHEQDTKMHEVYKGNIIPKLNKHTLKTSAAMDVWAVYFSQFWIDYEGMKSGKGRPVSFVDSFPLSVWICQPTRYTESQKELQTCDQVSLNTSQSESSDLSGRLKRKKLLKEYYSTESEPFTNGGQKPSSDTFLRFSSSSSEADIHVLVHVHKHVSLQINHYQYLLLLFLHDSLILLLENLRKDVEAVTGNPANQTSVCIGFLLRSAELALLLHPVDQANRIKSPVSESVSPVVPDYLPTENGEVLSSKRKQVSGINRIRSVTVNHMSDNRSMSVDLSHVPLKDPLLFKSASDTNLQTGISFLDYLSDKHLGKISEDESSGLVYKSGSGETGSEISDKKDSSCRDSNSILNNREDSNMLSFDNDGNPNIFSNSLTSKGNETIESIFKAANLLPEASSVSENLEISKEETPTVMTLKSHDIFQELQKVIIFICSFSLGSDQKTVIHCTSSPEISLRFVSGPGASVHSLLAEKNGFLQCHIENFSTEFLVSSLMNIQHFLEDETVATVMPMKIQVSNTKINLKSDSHMLNTENDLKENVKSDSVELTSGKYDLKKQRSVTQATQTSPEVPWPPQSVNFPECSFDFSREQLMEENESLKQELAKAKMALAEAHLEKDALLHHIKKMTVE
ncbi:PREDICTED: UHRF1-binding protein 1-like [Propithecus coquereli]|uniref:UHRF1-binding protein 1-like n=1 Tax=Propithecus coquereli TaxID=379532 RepID=UPI00063FC5AD|nr:PREDICTED: UHRF1-binding protein 1-like [Propithecus coquereli]